MKKLLLVVLAAAFVPVAAAQPLGQGVVSGTVVDAESGDPVRKALVTLTLQSTPRRWATARTDGSGHFQFDGLPPGKYELRAAKGSEGSANYGANHFHELGDLLALADGEIRAVTLRFLRAGFISGHVYDSDGDPVSNAAVNLMRKGRNLGAPILMNYRGATTDDHGEYRITNIDPGQYYLHATPELDRRIAEPNFQPKSILADEYYGGRDSKNAAALHVSGGEQLAGLDFRLPSEPVAQVHGRVTGVPAPAEAAASETVRPAVQAAFRSGRVDNGGIHVMISPVDAGPYWMRDLPAQPPDYFFQSPDLPSGQYRLEAVDHVAGKTYSASQVVDLHPGSSDIELTLAPTVDIHGSLRIEGDPGRRKQAAARHGVQISPPGNMRGSISADVDADGRFTLAGVSAGEWQLALNPAPSGYLKSAQFGGKDIRFTNFEVGSNTEAQLNIVVSMNMGVVEGQVEGASSDTGRSGIVLAPVGPFHDLARFYYGTTADDEGKFKLSEIAPGTYKVFALEKLAAQNFRNPESVDPLDKLGELVEVPEGAAVQAHPRLIPYERASEALQ